MTTSLALEDALPAAMLGEPWAVRVVYETLAPRVRSYLRVRGARDPDDLTSEVFLTVLTRLSTVTGGSAGLRSLTFSVAHARLVDDLRQRSRRPDPVAFDPDDDVRHAPSSEQEALAGLDTAGVLRLLTLLPEAQRDVLALRIVADLSLEQTATALGRSTGAVKQLQRRALLRLHAALATPAAPTTHPEPKA